MDRCWACYRHTAKCRASSIFRIILRWTARARSTSRKSRIGACRSSRAQRFVWEDKREKQIDWSFVGAAFSRRRTGRIQILERGRVAKHVQTAFEQERRAHFERGAGKFWPRSRPDDPSRRLRDRGAA